MIMKKILTTSLLPLSGALAIDQETLNVQYNEPTYTQKGAYEHYWNEIAYLSNPFQVNALIKGQDDSTLIVDLRSEEVFKVGHIPGAINFPPEKWGELDRLPKNKILILYCYNATCFLAKNAALHFIKSGFKAKEMIGGWQTWVDQGYPVEK